MEELNENGLKLFTMVGYLDDECGLGAYIVEMTRTSGKEMTLTDIYSKVVEDPVNIDWILDQGYFYPSYCRDTTPEEVKLKFNHFKKRVLERIELEQKATTFINEIADHSAAIIDRWENDE